MIDMQNDGCLSRVRPPKSQKRQCPSIPTMHTPCQPLGNLLFQSGSRNARNPGLGSLAVLTDELLSSIFSELDPIDLIRSQAVSRAFFVFARIEGHWKLHYIKRARGSLGNWRGSWRNTYISTFCAPDRQVSPTANIYIRNIYSDVLYLPYLAAKYDANSIVTSSSFANNIPRKDIQTLTNIELGNEPCILTGAMKDWAAMSADRRWSIPSLAERFPATQFRAEAVLTSMSQYSAYHDACDADESPLYVFDPDFVEKTGSETATGLGADFAAPEPFRDDLFKVLGDERPNYRWLVSTCSAVLISKWLILIRSLVPNDPARPSIATPTALRLGTLWSPDASCGSCFRRRLCHRASWSAMISQRWKRLSP